MDDQDKEISTLMQRLRKAESEMTIWNTGKLKNSSNAVASRLYVDALRQELAVLLQRSKPE